MVLEKSWYNYLTENNTPFANIMMWCDVDSNREKLPDYNNITLAASVEPLAWWILVSLYIPDNYSNVSVKFILKFYQPKFPKKLIIGHININSIRNKFEILKSMLCCQKCWTSWWSLIETKLDHFPQKQFHIEGFNVLFRLDLDYCYMFAIIIIIIMLFS